MLIKEKTIWTADNSYLLEYRGRIEWGEIIVGHDLWQELENLKEDFHNDDYFYNTDDAILRMDFMENCVRLTKSPFYNKPMVLMLWQKAFIETIYSFKMSDTNLDHIKQICKKPMKKVPKGLSEYGITTAEIEQMFLDFCNNKGNN